MGGGQNFPCGFVFGVSSDINTISCLVQTTDIKCIMKIDFVDVLEIVAPSKKMLNSGLQCKNHTLFLTKTAKKTHPLGLHTPI